MVEKDTLHAAYSLWAEDADVRDIYTMETFAQHLYTAGDNKIEKSRPRDGGVRKHVFTGVMLKPEYAELDYGGY